jgi:hypothetical protein
MGGGGIEGSVGWFVTISTKTLFLYLPSYILLSSMASVGRYTLLIGCRCYIMRCGPLGIVSLLICLSKMSTMNLSINIRLSMRQVKDNSIFHMVYSGNGFAWRSIMVQLPSLVCSL